MAGGRPREGPPNTGSTVVCTSCVSHQNDLCYEFDPFHPELVPAQVENLYMGVVDDGVTQEHSRLVLEVIVSKRHVLQVAVILHNSTLVGQPFRQT